MAHDLDIQKLAYEDQRLAEFATAVASLYATLYDERPAGVESLVDEGALLCQIQGGLTVGDLMMLQHGHVAELSTYREAFFKAVAGHLEMAVIAYTGHEVLTQETSFDPATVITTLRFELSPAQQDDADQREALRNWSQQVRRSSRRLRLQHAEARDVQESLAKRLHKQREERKRLQNGRS